jgi:hypothetical protein
MSEDISRQPSDGTTNTGENVPVQPLESTSVSEVIPVQSSDDTSMSEDVSAKVPEDTSANKVVPVQPLTKPAKAGNRWLGIVKRVLVGVVMVLAVLGLIVDGSALVGVWASYGPARNSVITVSNTLTQALQVANKGLTRVNGTVQTARQTLTQVNDQATQLGDKAKASSPLVTALSQRVDTRLAPILENVQTTAASIHDSVLKVNGALVALNRFPGVTVPTLSDQLSSVSDRAQQAESAVQDLRVTLANIKAGAVTKAETAVMQVTARIDAPLARIQGLVNTYQAKAVQAQDRVTSTTNTILTLLLVTAISLTLLFIIVAVALVLLIFVCWQYIRHGRFPSLRIVYD